MEIVSQRKSSTVDAVVSALPLYRSAPNLEVRLEDFELFAIDRVRVLKGISDGLSRGKKHDEIEKLVTLTPFPVSFWTRPEFRSYFMFHGMDVNQPEFVFKYLHVLSFTESYIYQMKVSLGAAKCLAFLHSAKTKVIYRDFKTSNVLLDSNYNAKLSDLGLAKDGPSGDRSHVSTRVMGTYGYAAPEYLATGHLTARSDVYNFGVVLLEMLLGRRVIDKNRPVSPSPKGVLTRSSGPPMLSQARSVKHMYFFSIA